MRKDILKSKLNRDTQPPQPKKEDFEVFDKHLNNDDGAYKSLRDGRWYNDDMYKQAVQGGLVLDKLSDIEIEKLSAKNKIDDANLEFDKKLAGNADQDYFAMYLELREKHLGLIDDIRREKARNSNYKEQIAKYMVDYILSMCEKEERGYAERLIESML